MMKKKLLTIVAAALCGSLFAGEYLCWMVDVRDEYAFTYASVSAGGDVLFNYSGVAGEEGEQYVGVNGFPTPGTQIEKVWAYDVSAYSSSSFVFELFNGDDCVWSESVSYQALKDASHIGSGMTAVKAYVVAAAIPEPTSGLLMLLGLAGLALKRKRARVA